MKKLSIQMSLRLSEPGYESDPSDLECSIHREVFEIIAASISRVSRWGPPPKLGGVSVGAGNGTGRVFGSLGG